MDLETRHPDYTATLALRSQGRDLFDGEHAVKAAGTSYLYQWANESDTDYDTRLQRAVLDPYVEKIIQARQAVLFRKPHARDLPAALDSYQWDIDRKGIPASVFFEEAALQAQIAGAHWVAIDATQVPEGGFASRRAESDSGYRAFMEHVPAENVIDWEVGPDMRLAWAVVKQTSRASREVPGLTPKQVQQWKVWFRDRWQLWQRPPDGKAAMLVDEQPNPLGLVPLVPFLGERYSDFAGYPVARRCFGYVIAVFNKQSDRDWFEAFASHPIPYQIGPEKFEEFNTSQGIYMRSMPDYDVKVGYLEPTGAAVGGIRETIRDYQAKIYAIALAQAQKDTAQVQSADGQREDRRMFTAGLASDSRAYERAEERCWELLAGWLGVPTEKITVAYTRDFDDKTIEATMIAALGDLMDRGILTQRTVLQTVVSGEAVEVEDIDAELAAAQAEQESRTAQAAARAMEQFRAAAQPPDADDAQADGEPDTP